MTTYEDIIIYRQQYNIEREKERERERDNFI